MLLEEAEMAGDGGLPDAPAVLLSSWLSEDGGTRIKRNLGSCWIKNFLTHGLILCVDGLR